jgi:hypothetical protein
MVRGLPLAEVESLVVGQRGEQKIVSLNSYRSLTAEY